MRVHVNDSNEWNSKDIKLAREEGFLQVFLTQVTLVIVYHAPGGGGGLPYERGGNARRKFWIKRPKETNLGVAQPLDKTNWKK